MGKYKAIILSAGKGTRMKSDLPKVVHKVCGKEMVNHVIDASKSAGIKEIIAVLGHKSEIVKEVLSSDIKTAFQKEQLGTGHAVKMAMDYINNNDSILILCGDTPLIKPETLQNLFRYHGENGYHATVLTTTINNPKGYGRIIRDNKQDLLKIVEEKDASENEKLIDEINSGIYCFNGESLKNALERINSNNAQGEYYLTDTIEIMRSEGLKVGAFNGATIDELMGVNSRDELAMAENIMSNRINEA